jgi:glycosyltransferase involved in cell wall biosynthesis
MEIGKAEERLIAEGDSLTTGRGTDRRVRLVFLIRSLQVGGAERQLVELAKGLDQTVFDVTVLCFYGGGEFSQELSNANISVISLDKSGRWDIPVFLGRLITLLRKLRPDRVVWGIEAAGLDLSQFDRVERLTSRLEALLSRLPDLIVFNSFAGRDHYVSSGFADSRTVVIHNGIDTKRFAPDTKSRARFRASWKIPEGALLIGVVGRLDPLKDHQTFLKAAARFAHNRPDARFLCIGGGPEKYLHDLRGLANDLGLTNKVSWTGFILDDMPAAYNALDICCSSSYTEGTSNAVAEAMACGVPCVVTDVGDSKLIVGETGILVPPKNPEALSAGWLAMAKRLSENPQLPHAVRERIELRLSLAALVRKTSESLLDLL